MAQFNQARWRVEALPETNLTFACLELILSKVGRTFLLTADRVLSIVQYSRPWHSWSCGASPPRSLRLAEVPGGRLGISKTQSSATCQAFWTSGAVEREFSGAGGNGQARGFAEGRPSARHRHAARQQVARQILRCEHSLPCWEATLANGGQVAQHLLQIVSCWLLRYNALLNAWDKAARRQNPSFCPVA